MGGGVVMERGATTGDGRAARRRGDLDPRLPGARSGTSVTRKRRSGAARPTPQARATSIAWWGMSHPHLRVTPRGDVRPTAVVAWFGPGARRYCLRNACRPTSNTWVDDNTWRRATSRPVVAVLP